MSLENLVFESNNEVIYDPERLNSGTSKQIVVTNMGLDSITELGLYIGPATTLGEVDYPADYPPETDYQDLIRWGEETFNGVAVTGGLRVTLPQNDGSTTVSWVTRSQGSTRANKLVMKDLAAGASATFTIEMITPPGVVARRLYINILFDTDYGA